MQNVLIFDFAIVVYRLNIIVCVHSGRE